MKRIFSSMSPSHSLTAQRLCHDPGHNVQKDVTSLETLPSSHSITIDFASDQLLIDNRELERFFSSEYFCALCPPCLNWRPLQTFLAKLDLEKPRRLSSPASTISRCLLHRIFPSQGDEEHLQASSDTERRDSERTLTGASTVSYCVERKIYTDHELLQRLGSNRAASSVERTIFFATNMTPLYAVAIVIRDEEIYQASLKKYLQCHVTGEVVFNAFQNLHTPSDCINWPRHVMPKYAFVFEFHMSYVALRKAGAGADPRGVRAHISMIEPLEVDVGLTEELICYDAQISFMIVGRANDCWKAYCNVDSWFGSENNVETYLANDKDGPSGGVRLASDLCLDPKEYFLLVLSQRFRQIGMEWGNVCTVLMARTDKYESRYLQTIDTADLYDDQAMSRTRSYSKAASMLRQYHDTLSTTLDRIQEFLNCNEDTFKDQKDFQDQCGCYFRIIDIELKHLSRWRRRLYERMQRFDMMRDGLLNVSVLRESRRSTQQAANIGILTKVTVAYLPWTLASGIFGLSNKPAERTVWLWWTFVSVILGLATFYFAFFHPKLYFNYFLGIVKRRIGKSL